MSNVFTVQKPNNLDYQIDGSPDPTLTLVRGETYTFDFIDNGHPFFIKSSLGSGTAGAYNEGVINQGSSEADKDSIFTAENDAPDVLFYQYSVHSAMNGHLNIVNASDQETVTTLVTQTVDLLVDAGVLADGPVYLQGLQETQSDTNHTTEYAGETYTDAIELVGMTQITATLVSIAGADGASVS